MRREVQKINPYDEARRQWLREVRASCTRQAVMLASELEWIKAKIFDIDRELAGGEDVKQTKKKSSN